MSQDKPKSCSACDKADCDPRQQRPGETPEMHADRLAILDRMGDIKHKILVLSGKGGVGKSTVAANLALSLAENEKEVGLLDVDIHGPSIPQLLKLDGTSIVIKGETLVPPRVGRSLKVMSMGFMLRHKDDAIIWRGPMKIGAIKQLLKDTEWSALDYLIVDCPPGTGDEPLSVAQLIENADGAIIVTTPQELALLDVRKSINFCRKLSLPILGVIENMSGFVCPKCGETINVFKAGGAEKMAKEVGVPFLGRVPLDPEIVRAGDAGETLAERDVAEETMDAFQSICDAIEKGPKE
ncbi:MAG: Mrp/NBP35 family ATP-binding protein [Planctomycetes bacterium]|nr:Mrp/NBP35 family ATP-binding protein [Planctomycetota bacterium]